MRLRYQVRNSNNQSDVSTFKNTRFDFCVPTLIIVTFILFTIVPNTFRTTVFLWKDAPSAFSFNNFLIAFGYFFDPLIYIFSIRNIKRRVQQKVSAIFFKTKVYHFHNVKWTGTNIFLTGQVSVLLYTRNLITILLEKLKLQEVKNKLFNMQ